MKNFLPSKKVPIASASAPVLFSHFGLPVPSMLYLPLSHIFPFSGQVNTLSSDYWPHQHLAQTSFSLPTSTLEAGSVFSFSASFAAGLHVTQLWSVRYKRKSAEQFLGQPLLIKGTDVAGASHPPSSCLESDTLPEAEQPSCDHDGKAIKLKILNFALKQYHPPPDLLRGEKKKSLLLVSLVNRAFQYL